jgi:hypothetical protein
MDLMIDLGLSPMIALGNGNKFMAERRILHFQMEHLSAAFASRET